MAVAGIPERMRKAVKGNNIDQEACKSQEANTGTAVAGGKRPDERRASSSHSVSATSAVSSEEGNEAGGDAEKQSAPNGKRQPMAARKVGDQRQKSRCRPRRSCTRSKSRSPLRSRERGHAPPPWEAGAGVPQPMLSPEEMQISACLSLRKKYSMGKQRIAPIQVGFDDANRDGIRLNGKRCDELLGDVCVMGFDLNEANHDNVAVQVRPGDLTISKHNESVCLSSKFLAVLNAAAINFSSLSHSHLHQCIKNILGKAFAVAPARFCHEGALSMELVHRRDPALAEACQTGLVWEVLAWQIRDEPDALRLIQAACNRKSLAQMKETEMQAVSRLSSICSGLAARAGDGVQVAYGAAREQLSSTMPEVANSSDFMGMLRFVITLGAEAAPFLPYLRDFIGHRGQGRHVRLSLFGEASRMPSALPWLMVAVVIMGYTAPEAFFTDGMSRFVCAADMKVFTASGGAGARSGDATEKAMLAETILSYFHVTCKQAGVFSGLGEGKILDFLGLLDSTVARFMTEKHMGAKHEQIQQLEDIADIYYEDMKRNMAPAGIRIPPRMWDPRKDDMGLSGRARSSDTAKGTKQQGGVDSLEPRIIQYNEDGKAMNEQATYRKMKEVETVPWETSERPNVALEAAKSQLLYAIKMSNDFLIHAMSGKFTILRSSGDLSVRATEDLAIHEVGFVPMVSSAAFISQPPKKGAASPSSVRVQGYSIESKDGLISELLINSCLKMPPRGTSFAEYKKPISVHPFWAMRRVGHDDADAEVNMEIEFVRFDQVFNVGFAPLLVNLRSAGTGASDYGSVYVPVARNCKAIQTDDELVLRVSKHKKAKAEEEYTWDTRPRKEPKPSKSSQAATDFV